jgi:hypothetical protein
MVILQNVAENASKELLRKFHFLIPSPGIWKFRVAATWGGHHAVEEGFSSTAYARTTCI